MCNGRVCFNLLITPVYLEIVFAIDSVCEVHFICFISNINKQQLIKLLLRVWSNDASVPKLERKTVIAVCDEKAYKFSSDDSVLVKMTEVPKLQSSQEETDTRVVLYCNYAADNDYAYVKVRSPDSDIFLILLYYAADLGIRILFDTGTGNKRRLLDITKLAKDFTPVYQRFQRYWKGEANSTSSKKLATKGFSRSLVKHG